MDQRYQWQAPAWVALGAILLVATGGRTESTTNPTTAAAAGTATVAAETTAETTAVTTIASDPTAAPETTVAVDEAQVAVEETAARDAAQSNQEVAVSAQEVKDEVSDSPSPAVTSESTETRVASGAGVRAFIDPATGRLTANPSPEQLRGMALTPRAVVSRSTVGLQPFELDAGGRGMNLQGRFSSALRVARNDDGTFRVTCGDPDHAAAPHSHEVADTAGVETVTAISNRAAER